MPAAPSEPPVPSVPNTEGLGLADAANEEEEQLDDRAGDTNGLGRANPADPQTQPFEDPCMDIDIAEAEIGSLQACLKVPGIVKAFKFHQN